MLICGIDEAGRGPVIGPLVICGVVIEDKKLKHLEAIGVKDSKELTPSARQKLFYKIKKLVKNYKVVIVEPHEIDESVNSEKTNINWLEAKKSALIINNLKPDKVIIDCPSNNVDMYREMIIGYLEDKSTAVILEHKADTKYPIVGAASIIAKVTRDFEIEKIKKNYNVEFGSGYPSDELTQKFLKENFNRYSFFRKSWASYKEASKKGSQSKLTDF